MSYTPKPGSQAETLLLAIAAADNGLTSRELTSVTGIGDSVHAGCLEAAVRYGVVAISIDEAGTRRLRRYTIIDRDGLKFHDALYASTDNSTGTGTLFAPKPIVPHNIPATTERHATPTRAAQAPKRARDTQVGGDHYQIMPIQPWDVIDTWPLEQRVGYYRGTALGYQMRLGSKDTPAQEARKAEHVCQKLAEVLEEAAAAGGQ